MSNSSKPKGIVENWFTSSSLVSSQSEDVSESTLDITTNTWSDTITINRVIRSGTSGGLVQAKQSQAATDLSLSAFVGSVIDGGSSKDTLRGLAGWDVLDGNDNDDLIHGGNGRDIISGGAGEDELHGDFGWNTFRSEKDGYDDLIAIKSDQHLSNWWYGTAGNSPNGEKADFIEGLDAIDEIKIIGVYTSDLTFAANTSARGVSGIGIYAKGTLEAVYTGGDLSVSQIQSMTTGDASTLAMNNKMWSYRGDNTVPDLLA